MKFHGRLYCGMLLLNCWLSVPSAGVQNAPAPKSVPNAAEASAKLNVHVRLMLGPTTLAQVTAAMSQQTGLDIKGADYLQERKLVVMLDDVRLVDALDALADANEWAWRQDSPGQIVIAHRVSRLRQTPSSIPGLLRSALPRDWRAFLGFPAPDKSLARTISPTNPSKRPRVFTVYGAALNRLRATLDSEAVAKMPLTYKNMTPAQQEMLRLIMVCQTLWATNRDLLYSDLMPHLVDPATAIIRFKPGNMFVAGSRVKENGQETEATFGANIGEAKEGGQDGAKP